MHGLMMNMPLTISSLIRHADRYHGDTEIVSRTVEGDIHRYTYRDAHARARRAANALRKLGVKMSDRVATLAWNGFRHYELYYAISGIGAVINTAKVESGAGGLVTSWPRRATAACAAAASLRQPASAAAQRTWRHAYQCTAWHSRI